MSVRDIDLDPNKLFGIGYPRTLIEVIMDSLNKIKDTMTN